jgi:hypothetical protein
MEFDFIFQNDEDESKLLNLVVVIVIDISPYTYSTVNSFSPCIVSMDLATSYNFRTKRFG